MIHISEKMCWNFVFTILFRYIFIYVATLQTFGHFHKCNKLSGVRILDTNDIIIVLSTISTGHPPPEGGHSC